MFKDKHFKPIFAHRSFTKYSTLGWEDPLEKGMITHSSILAWRILWTVIDSPWGHKELDTTERLSLTSFLIE